MLVFRCLEYIYKQPIRMINSAKFTPGADVFAWSAGPESLSAAVLTSSEPTFSLVRCSEPLDKTKTTGEDASTKCLLIEPQSSLSSLIAIVPAVSPPVVVRLFDVRQSRRLRDLTFSSPVRAIRLNMRRLVVMLEDHVQIFDTETLRNLYKFDAPRQSAADCCALSGNCILAIGASKGGSVLLFDALNLRVLQVISAHQSAVSSLALSEDGQMLATASETGTLVRVFSVSTGEKLCVFRRGSYSCKVKCLAFSSCGGAGMNIANEDASNNSTSRTRKRASFLAVGSENGTVHVFQIPPQSNDPTANGGSTAQTISSYLFSNWLPHSVSDIVEPTRCINLARTKSTPLACSFFEMDGGKSQLLRVITADGYFREFSLAGSNNNETSPFELPLVRYSRLIGGGSEERSASASQDEVGQQRGGDDDEAEEDDDNETTQRGSPLTED